MINFDTHFWRSIGNRKEYRRHKQSEGYEQIEIKHC